MGGGQGSRVEGGPGSWFTICSLETFVHVDVERQINTWSLRTEGCSNESWECKQMCISSSFSSPHDSVSIYLLMKKKSRTTAIFWHIRSETTAWFLMSPHVMCMWRRWRSKFMFLLEKRRVTMFMDAGHCTFCPHEGAVRFVFLLCAEPLE